MKRTHPMCSWRAGCGGTRKSGSEGGGEETTGRKAGTGTSPPTLRSRHARLASNAGSASRPKARTARAGLRPRWLPPGPGPHQFQLATDGLDVIAGRVLNRLLGRRWRAWSNSRPASPFGADDDPYTPTMATTSVTTAAAGVRAASSTCRFVSMVGSGSRREAVPMPKSIDRCLYELDEDLPGGIGWQHGCLQERERAGRIGDPFASPHPVQLLA